MVGESTDHKTEDSQPEQCERRYVRHPIPTNRRRRGRAMQFQRTGHEERYGRRTEGGPTQRHVKQLREEEEDSDEDREVDPVAQQNSHDRPR